MEKLINLIESLTSDEQEKLTEQGQFVHLWSLIDCLSIQWNTITFDSEEEEDKPGPVPESESGTDFTSDDNDEISFHF